MGTIAGTGIVAMAVTDTTSVTMIARVVAGLTIRANDEGLARVEHTRLTLPEPSAVVPVDKVYTYCRQDVYLMWTSCGRLVDHADHATWTSPTVVVYLHRGECQANELSSFPPILLTIHS